MRFLGFAGFAIVFAVSALCAPPAGNDLTIYMLDMEGGQSTIYLTPSGETILVDTGFPGGRDAGRILEALKTAGIREIDYMVTTHYHGDHVGGLEEVAGKIPIHTYIDHGTTVEPREQLPNFQATYAGLYAKAKHEAVKPGDKIPIKGLDVLVVTAGGQTLKTPLPNAGKSNSYCSKFERRDPDADPENVQSVGLLFTYGKFRTINLGDFTWNEEYGLMCPNNPIGRVDLYLTSHHGMDRSGSPALVYALQPVVAVMNNGTRKGGAAHILGILHGSPGLEDLWQLHWSYQGGLEYNTPGEFIANMDDPATAADIIVHPPTVPASPAPPAAAAPAPSGGRGRGFATGHTPAYWIKVTAHSDGTFTVFNPRNNFSKTYQGGRWQQ